MLLSLFAVAALIGFTGLALAETHTRGDAKALVQKAVAYLESNGREKAFAAFDDPKGQFVDGDLYLFVMDAKDPQLTMLAHGAMKALVGKPQIDVTDADGKAFNKDMVKMLATQDEGWIEYRWPNPVTHKIAPKVAFVKKVDGVIIGCGIYQ